jgi:hypothetical protein
MNMDLSKIDPKIKIAVTKQAYQDATENYMGWCPNCKDFTREGTEPDAEQYDCPECEENCVVGAEDALLMGLFDIV